MKSIRHLLTLAITTFAIAPMLSAQARPAGTVDSALFRGLSYRYVGPNIGGRVTTVTGVPTQPTTFYMGVASGGVFKTTDNGTTWLPVTDGKVPVGSTGSIAVADSDPNTVYIGTGSDGVRSNVSTGRGVYKSTDAGNSWQFAGLYDVGQIGAVRIHPTNPDIVWVAANGDIFKKSVARGIYKSVDGGRNWRKTLFVSDSSGAMDVEIMPGNPNTLYAWISRIERKPWTIISGSREGGFYKSTDAGETWRRVTQGLPGNLIGKANLAVTAANPNRIYALIEASPGGGLYRSDNGGETWQLVNSTEALTQRPFYYTTIGADPTNADIVYAGAESFFKSTDAGVTVTRMATPHTDNHDIWINPTNGNIMVQANDGGANVSTDGGRTWSTQSNQPTSEIYGIWTDNEFPYNLYGAQQDNNTVIISSLAIGGTQGVDRRGGPGCETGPILPHPRGPDIIYGSCKGQYEVFFAKSGQTRQYWVGGQSLYGNDAKDLILRFQRVSPMNTSPHDPDVLYYGSQKVHRTRDYGKTWETISPDLTWFPPCCQGASGEPITRDVTGEEFYSTLYAIAESPLEAGVIWTGANDGPFFVTRDNGKSWTNVTPRDLTLGGRVAWIEPSKHRRGSAYYAVYRYLHGDYAPYIYRTDDYGRNWTKLTNGQNGIPADAPTRAIREDPNREGLLFAGTEFGMFVSFNNGANWQSFQLNLPNVPINDIRIHNKDLIVATQGRGFWIIDNISSVEQMGGAAQQSASQVHLYKPRDGYRTRTAPGLYGPTIEYFLPSATTEPITIEILDEKGTAVNKYSNAPVAPAGAAAAPAGGGGGRGGAGGGRGAAAGAAAAGGGGGGGGGRGGRGGAVGSGSATGVTPNTVSAKAGLNRFVWGMQHNSGMLAPPGSYRARLSVGSTTLTTDFKVLVDPRLAAEGVTAQDLAVLFEHNTRMNELNNAVRAANTRIMQAETRLRGATGVAADTLTKLQAIAAKIRDEPVRYGKPGLEEHITYLRGMTANVEQHPGSDALARYAVLKKDLDAVVADLNRVLGPAR